MRMKLKGIFYLENVIADTQIEKYGYKLIFLRNYMLHA